GSHAAELMHAGKGSDCRVVFNRDVARKRRRVRHDDVAAEHAVVPNMRVRHQKIVISDSRVAATALCAAMDIHVLAKNVVMADREECFLAFELEILGLQPDGSE